MDQFLQQLTNGLLNGALYALVSIGMTVIFGMMRVVNVAHGELFMLGGLFTWYVAATLNIPFAASVFLGVLAVGCLGLVVERFLLRPIRNATMVTSMLVMLGLSLLLQNLALMVTEGVPHNIASPFTQHPLVMGPVQTDATRLFAAVIATLMIIALHLGLHRTKWGNAIRAAFQDKEASSLVGINVNLVYMATYGIGAAFAALGGALIGTITYVYPMMGADGLVKAFVVVVIGGMGSFAGAIIGGLFLGVVEAVSAGYIGSAYQNVIGFSAVILFLMFRPTGFLGKKES